MKEAGYFLDAEAKKKVAKARALDEALFGRHYDRKKVSESHDRIFGKERKKTICADCKKKCVHSIGRVENNKVISRCYSCDNKVRQ